MSYRTEQAVDALTLAFQALITEANEAREDGDKDRELILLELADRVSDVQSDAACVDL